ncbi:putative lysine-specific demethylase JMJ16 [Morus notabilis]|uniref:putative lysine-specific demethylase JMJ16 n=1 Tax=Morus notabilis TaxID=981085 RepID=UPI000CED4906|nr:putative lysine-specific demethylase JMJ16 [Morus notabilis]XP_024025135.1 putative lysine-specific demethylase JMJ16 [Morus notabilis]XP_024025136.1 putative lysine-specific demethylase JMJ16 [Morus notabilis]XP_024025137.1 putative lysine-specific demethylase JMJ16 [Morus notabilis]
MGTELMRVCVKEDNDDFPPVPPGFESFTSFNLKRVNDAESQDSKNMLGCFASVGACEPHTIKMETNVDASDAAKVTRSLRRKPWINYGRQDCDPEDDCDSERLEQNFPTRLSKGVFRGCSECSNCQKVAARWRPEGARKLDIQDAPIFYPTEQEFEDTLRYIASIRSKAEPYGICRIVPPPSWKPPCPLKEKKIWEDSRFATRVQRIDKLQNRDSLRKMSIIQSQMKRKRRRCTRMGADCVTGSRGLGDAGYPEAETFGFEPGPEFTLEMFEKYADDFKAQYFSKNANVTDMGGNLTMPKGCSEPSVDNIEGEYWRMVEKPTEEIEVLYGADLETGAFGSGFPKMSNQDSSASEEQYVKSGWNLNNFPRLPGSVLSYETSDISGVLVPWLYIGMCFSSFCWHVEDHHLYSLNYMHWGAPKLWYGVPGKDACKLEEAMRKHLPDLFEEQPDLLHKLVTQLSPSILKSEGVPVYRCVQNPGEFVLTFPRAYHSGFNCGFNCAEAVNVAPVDWLPHGQIAIELYYQQGRKTSISHDKLLLGAAREAVRAHWELNLLKKNTSDNLRWKDVCGKDGILVKALKSRVEMERMRREFLCSSSQAVKMESNFDAASERECSVCLFDLHLSAAGCHCSPDKYACLNHAKQLCPCAWGDKFFLFRYDISDLNILVEALEGKLSSIYRWARQDLGLALSSYVNRDNMHVAETHSDRGAVLEGRNSQPSVSSLKKQLATEIPKEKRINSSNNNMIVLALGAPLPSKDTAPSSTSHSPNEIAGAGNNSWFKKQETINLDNPRTSVCQLSQEDTSYVINPVEGKPMMKKTSVSEHYDVILLSDDEGEDVKNSVSDKEKETDLSKRLIGPDDKVSSCNDIKDPNHSKSVTGGTSEKVGCSLPDVERNGFSSCSINVKIEPQENDGQVGSNPQNLSPNVGSLGPENGRNIQGSAAISENNDHNITNVRNDSQHQHPCVSGKPESGAKSSAENTRALTGNASSSQNNLDRYYRQKGPRIAKVVRRINCMVEPLEFGVVLSGKSWCNSQAIFPKGFKSRVRYMNVLDPSNTCYYISEVLDAGRDVPLFMVSLENCPSEMFIHGSAVRCWEMVRERVNQEIARQHKSGRLNLPPLQPPGSLDGFEMFGFTSPAIVQVIEAMDRNRVCSEYWDSRPYSRPQVQIPQTSRSKETGGRTSEQGSAQGPPDNHLLPSGVDAILGGLFKKANVEELNSLYRMLNDNQLTVGRDLVTRLLNEEINNRPR